MSDRALSDILDRCIDDLNRGKTVEDCLIRYPAHAAELEPLLRAAGLAQSWDYAQRSQVARDVARSRFNALLEKPATTRRRPTRRRWMSPPWSMALRLVLATLVVLLLFSGSVVAAQSSRPGDVLYGVRLYSERVRLSLAGDELARSRLALTFAYQRAEDLQYLVETNQPVDPALVDLLIVYQEQALAALEGATPSAAQPMRWKLIELLRQTNTILNHLLTTAATLDQRQLLERALEHGQAGQARLLAPERAPDAVQATPSSRPAPTATTGNVATSTVTSAPTAPPLLQPDTDAVPTLAPTSSPAQQRGPAGRSTATRVAVPPTAEQRRQRPPASPATPTPTQAETVAPTPPPPPTQAETAAPTPPPTPTQAEPVAPTPPPAPTQAPTEPAPTTRPTQAETVAPTTPPAPTQAPTEPAPTTRPTQPSSPTQTPVPAPTRVLPQLPLAPAATEPPPRP